MKSAPLSLVFGAVLLLAGCADRNPLEPGAAAPPGPSLQRLECAARVREATLACAAASAFAGDARGAILGGQGIFVRLNSHVLYYDSATATFAANVGPVNQLDLPMGTLDGVTVDPEGIRVFFHSGPVVTEGTGSVWVSNADGESSFTAAHQPFFRYVGILPPSWPYMSKRWTWHVEPTVKVFSFTLLVDVRTPPGLVIDEIMAHPTTESEAAGEWFELYNYGPAAVDLEGWTIASGGDAGYTVHGTLVIERGAYLVLGGSTDTAANGGTPVAHAYTGVRLGNDTGDWLELRSPAGRTVNSVAWGAAAGEEASPPPTGAALALDPSRLDNRNLGGPAWAPATAVYGAGQRGTPGARNPGALALIDVAPGQYHTCGVDAAGQAWCWGYNGYSQLGQSVDLYQRWPAPVAGPPGTRFVRAAMVNPFVSGDQAGSCALSSGGRVYCWGNVWGSGGSPVPTILGQPEGVSLVSITAGTPVCGLDRDGQAWCWGRLSSQTGFSGTALPQPPGVRFSSLAVGASIICGLTPAGAVYCWDDHTENNAARGFVAAALPPGETFTAIAALEYRACAVAASGQAYCWGPYLDPATPVAVKQPDGVRFTAVAVGGLHACGLSSSGQAYCWGGNEYGMIGDGTLTGRDSATAVLQPAGVRFSAIRAGRGHTCGLEEGSGRPWCWGYNWFGQLGDGTTLNRSVPVAAGRRPL